METLRHPLVPTDDVVPASHPASDPEEEDDVGLDSTEENDLDLKPLRPPRKKDPSVPVATVPTSHNVKVEIDEDLKEALYEEDIVEGFSFASFKTYEDLEVRKKKREKSLLNYA